jgi:neutral amino acid transport system substrate-binding protein
MTETRLQQSHQAQTDRVKSPSLTRRRARRAWLLALLVGTLVVALGCAKKDTTTTTRSDEVILIGASLPFTGDGATVGGNVEQALLLAIEDINAAGGVSGRRFELTTVDSNSGGSRGKAATTGMIDTNDIKYLFGPEDNHLAADLVSVVKSHDILHFLPAAAAPAIRDTGSRGAWLRLSQSARSLACALAMEMRNDGIEVANALITSDPFHQAVAAEFNTIFSLFGGRSVPSLTIKPGRKSYVDALQTLQRFNPDATLLLAYPPTGATVVGNWAYQDSPAELYLGPLLFDEAFLWNIPPGTAIGSKGITASLNHAGECVTDAGNLPLGHVACKEGTSRSFIRHYKNRWHGESPLPASHRYYDAVVLLALGLQRANSFGETDPSAQVIKAHIRALTRDDGEQTRWNDLDDALEAISDGEIISYQGAAGEYIFNRYGEATFALNTVFEIDDNEFREIAHSECVLRLQCDDIGSEDEGHDDPYATCRIVDLWDRSDAGALPSDSADPGDAAAAE